MKMVILEYPYPYWLLLNFKHFVKFMGLKKILTFALPDISLLVEFCIVSMS